MADRILATFYLTASAAGEEIPLPKYTEGNAGSYYNTVYDYSYFHSDSVYYMFTDLHSGSMELLGKTDGVNLDKIYGTSIPGGIFIDSSTAATMGPFRLAAHPPRFLYSANPSGEPCRVTILLVR
jgi:hypothetical protein